MTMTKTQCIHILVKAKEHQACFNNYEPAVAAFEEKDYGTFEKICRGNLTWLQRRGIPTPFSPTGPYVLYSDNEVHRGEVNDEHDDVGIKMILNKRTGLVESMYIFNNQGEPIYSLKKGRSGSATEAYEHLVKLTDALHLQLGLQPLPSTVG